MKYYNNSVFSATIAILIFILNIKNIKGAGIKCSDCEYVYAQKKCQKKNDGADCPSYCRPHFYEGECYDCSEAFKNDVSQLYQLDVNNKKCGNKSPYSTGGSETFITSETNEIIDYDEFINKANVENPPFFLFGNFIYKGNCPVGTSPKDTEKYYCICNSPKYTYIDHILERTFKKCVDSCPYGYYYYLDGEYRCLKQCNDGYKLIIASNNSCVQECPPDHPFYFELDGKKYCSKKCPSKAPFYYSNIIKYKGIECKEKCNNGDFYFSDTKECITYNNCGSGYKLCIDFDNSVFICLKQISGTTQCPSSFPYEYSNLCLKKML